MGLDMYLNAEMYVSEFSDKVLGKKLAKLVGKSAPGRVNGIKTEAMYWRKANAIHAWFVTHVQKGVDKCEPHDVSVDQLTELRNLCAAVIESPEKAGILLPSQSGFFFGGTEYDEYYFDDLKNTVIGLDKVLNNPDRDKWSYEYRSSW